MRPGFSVGGTGTDHHRPEVGERRRHDDAESATVSLAGHRAEFIELDGSVGLTLPFDDAQVQGGALTWTVAAQPWEDGDLLMLRIEEILPEVFLDDLASSVVQGEGDPFTVRAIGLSPTTSYGIRLSTDNGHLGFDDDCSAPGKTRFTYYRAAPPTALRRWPMVAMLDRARLRQRCWRVRRWSRAQRPLLTSRRHRESF